jgi:transcriptional regulator with XRE-family HTH domain
MPNDADRAGTPSGVFGAELRFYRTRADLCQKDLAALVHAFNGVISKIETGKRPPAEDFSPRLDAVPELETGGALTRLWDHLKKGPKQRLYGWFNEECIEDATVTRSVASRYPYFLLAHNVSVNRAACSGSSGGALVALARDLQHPPWRWALGAASLRSRFPGDGTSRQR